MPTKELAMETIRDHPEDASWEQIEERIHFLAAIEAAREDVKSGKVVDHAEVSDLLTSSIQWERRTLGRRPLTAATCCRFP